MPNPEKEAFDEYAEMGIELPKEAEPQDTPEEKPEPEAPAPEEKPEPEVVDKEEDNEPLQPESQPEPPKKRSIYDEYKDKKSELKSVTERAEEAERERDELRTKLEAQADASTPAEQKKADDDLAAFAKEINADPEALARMKDLFLKDAQPAQIEGLEDFKKWQSENSEAIEAANLAKEFEAAKPELDRLFPNASAEDHEAIKTELTKLAHTKEFHDKELAYIAFKNQSSLSNLTSPKKKGLEPKGRADAAEVTDYKFDPDADISKMSPAEAEKWEAAYQKASSNPEGLQTDSLGRSILI